MIEALLVVDGEGRRLLGVERRQAGPFAARSCAISRAAPTTCDTGRRARISSRKSGGNFIEASVIDRRRREDLARRTRRFSPLSTGLLPLQTGSAPISLRAVGGAHRLAESEALREFAAKLRQFDRVRFGLRALGDDVHAEIMRHGDHRAQDRPGARRRRSGDQRRVDLERVEMIALEMAERGVAGAEIVERRARRRSRAPAAASAPRIPDSPSPGFRSARVSTCRAARKLAIERRLRTSLSRSWPQQLARGDVDAGENRRLDFERLLPGGEFARRRSRIAKTPISTERAVSSASDMKSPALKQAEARMLPAQHRLEAGDGAVFEPHDRLEQHA